MTYNHNNNDGIAVIRIIVSFLVIIASLIAIYVVVVKVSRIRILDKIQINEESHNSLNITTDTNAGNSLFVKDDKGLKFRKEDKTFAREEWIEKNAELFYFDTAGYGINGELKKEGQVYTFDNGKLINIKKDTSYVYRAKDDLYSSVETNQYLVWLDDEESEKGFYPIKYKQYSDDSEDYLGTIKDKQYATANMIKIYMSNIYYLAVGKGTEYAGRLYRMRPGAVHKESVGIGVTGYIVLSDDVVYYCDGQRVMKAKSWRGIEIDALDPEEEELLNILNNLPDGVATNSEVVVPILEDDKKLEVNENNNISPVIEKDDKNENNAKNENSENNKIKTNTNNNDVIVIRPGDNNKANNGNANAKVGNKQMYELETKKNEDDEVVISGLPTPDAKIKIQSNEINEDKSKGVRVNGPVAVQSPN